MEYRRLGRTGIDVGLVSLGTEYLIDLPLKHVEGVVREAAEKGVNYFDLFYGQGYFRDVMGAAFSGLREKVLLAGHLGAIERDGQSDRTREAPLAERFFEDFLRRFRTDHVDVLFLHNCDSREDYDAVMRGGGLSDLAQRLKAEGKARAVGFSGHTVSTARAAVDSGAVDVLMFPISLAGHAVEGKAELLKACARRDVGVVAMKPFAGGRLLQRTTEVEADAWLTGVDDRKLTRRSRLTPARCLSYALSQVGVSTAVPGCKDLSELAASLAFLEASLKERDFSAVLKDFEHYVDGECVYCNHCLPCPSSINIGAVLRLVDAAREGSAGLLRDEYAALAAGSDACVECGACVKRCPFGVDAMASVIRAADILA
ncbi:MAG: aldo/keto reductase [Planctomycetota bacterium]|jgi:predicted aldo/keto reductase-like oxidoreductase